jgi:hypothetical protein
MGCSWKAIIVAIKLKEKGSSILAPFRGQNLLLEGFSEKPPSILKGSSLEW